MEDVTWQETIATPEVWWLCKPWVPVGKAVSSNGKSTVFTPSNLDLEINIKVFPRDYGVRHTWAFSTIFIDSFAGRYFVGAAGTCEGMHITKGIKLPLLHRPWHLCFRVNPSTNASSKKLSFARTVMIWRWTRSKNISRPRLWEFQLPSNVCLKSTIFEEV